VDSITPKNDTKKGGNKMRIALVHAMTESVQPIEEAFRRVAPNVTLLHFMDTGLLYMLEDHGEITPAVSRRFSRLLNSAIDSNVDLIQLTCSAFNNLANVLQPLYEVKIFRSDEAMLDEALRYKRIGLISTVQATPIALKDYLYEKSSKIHVESLVNRDALHFLKQGKKMEHDRFIQGMIREMEDKVDVIVLSQYSMAHVADLVECSVPILTGTALTAKRCMDYLHSTKETD
jgi:Asp/Glu/hydantoin racemase